MMARLERDQTLLFGPLVVEDAIIFDDEGFEN